MTNKEVMQMALDALVYERYLYDLHHNECDKGLHDAIKELRAALAQPEHGCAECDKKQSEGWALYCVDCLREFYKNDPTNKREWVGLTYEDISSCIAKIAVNHMGFASAIEAKLKEKNT